MKRIVRLTESDLTRIVGRVIQEQKNEELLTEGISDILKKIKSKFSKQKEEKLPKWKHYRLKNILANLTQNQMVKPYK